MPQRSQHDIAPIRDVGQDAERCRASRRGKLIEVV